MRDMIWLEEIKRRTGLTEPGDLDRRFARDPDRMGAELYQQFRQISLGKRSPPRTGQLGDLVALVDADPMTNGTRDLFESSFWKLLESPPATVQAATDQLSAVLKSLGLRRASDAETMLLRMAHPKLSREALVVESATGAVRHQHLLKALTLYAAMYREADLASCFKLLDPLIQATDRALERLLSDYLRVDFDLWSDYYHDVLNALRTASRPQCDLNGNGWLDRELLLLPIVKT